MAGGLFGALGWISSKIKSRIKPLRQRAWVPSFLRNRDAQNAFIKRLEHPEQKHRENGQKSPETPLEAMNEVVSGSGADAERQKVAILTSKRVYNQILRKHLDVSMTMGELYNNLSDQSKESIKASLSSDLGIRWLSQV